MLTDDATNFLEKLLKIISNDTSPTTGLTFNISKNAARNDFPSTKGTKKDDHEIGTKTIDKSDKYADTPVAPNKRCFPCTICGHKYSYKRCLEKHIRQKHPGAVTSCNEQLYSPQ